MNAFSLIEVSTESGIAVLTLNRPDKRNAISDDLRKELIEALDEITADRSIRAMVLTGRGKGFCAGGDVGGMQQRMQAPAGEIAFNGWSRQQGVHHAISLLYNMPKPTIAAVNGSSAGLGADMALSCDFVVASEQATFAWTYVLRGLIPDGGGLHFLPRRVGLSRAKELIFTGRTVDAQEALRLGIADRVTGADDLLAAAKTWASELSRASAPALALSKRILNKSFELSAEDIFAQGSQAQSICYTTTEHQRSVAEFLQKPAAKK